MSYISFQNNNTGATEFALLQFRKSNDFASVGANDSLARIVSSGYDLATQTFKLAAYIECLATGAPSTNVPSELRFVSTNGTVNHLAMTVGQNGQVDIANPATNQASLVVHNNQSTPNINLRTANATATNAPHIHFNRSRAGTADVLANDELGRCEFLGFQGGTAREAAEISAVAQTVNGTNAVSSYLSFSTVPTTYAAIAERLRISADGNVTINNPVSGTAFTISGGGESVLGAITLNATGAANTNINGTSNSGTVTIGNTSSGAITIDCGTAGISVGTTANAHSSTFGSTNTTSATTVQSGTGALNVTSTNGALTINSGTGTLGLSNDASNTTVNLATGAGVKTVTLGSTNTTSSLVLRSGTGNIVANTGLTVDSTGRMTNGVQPAFHAYIGAVSVLNVTGDGTFYTVIYPTERFDVGNSYNAATGVFTAPVAGKYLFTAAVRPNEIGAAMTTGVFVYSVSGSQQGGSNTCNPANGRSVSGFADYFTFQSTLICNLAAGDTVLTRLAIFGSTKTVDITFNNADSFFAGYLLG